MPTTIFDTTLDTYLDQIQASPEKDKGFILTLKGDWELPTIQVLDARILFHYTDSTFCRQNGLTIMLLFDLHTAEGKAAFEAWEKTGLGGTFRSRINDAQATCWMHIGEERILLYRILEQTFAALSISQNQSIDMDLHFF